VEFRFDRPLAPASAVPTAFSVAEFDPDAGWATLSVAAVTLTDSDRAVTLSLERPFAASLVRVVARGGGPTPLLGADLVPVGAAGGTDPPLTLSRSPSDG
jgi:hypothetical protein